MDISGLKVGDKVFVPDEKRPYRVKCRDDRFIICTKPFNPLRTVRYFIIDLDRQVRGPDNMVFCSGYETQEQCEERLKELQKGDNRNHSIQYFDNYSDAEIRFYSVIATDIADKTIDYNAAYLIDSYGNTIEYKVFDRRVEKGPEPEPEVETEPEPEQQTESEN